MATAKLTADHIRELLRRGEHKLLREYYESVTGLDFFQPRPDCPEEFDEQTSFMESTATFSVLLGGNACIAGESEIYDPVADEYRRVDQITGPFHVLAWDGERAVTAAASRPFVKGVADLFRVTMSDGQQFTATAKHRVLASDGRWLFVEQLASPRRATLQSLTDPAHVVKVEFERRDVFYDLTVAEYHNYWMAGVFHHNSGKTICAAAKTAIYLRDTKPYRQNCPFWILGETFEQTCSTCWDEKLSKFIHPRDILAIDWHKHNRNWPRAVILRHPDDRNKPGWVIEFKSYDQGVLMMQGRSIGGYWFNEEAPLEIVSEVQVRCRDYDSPGWADFTPAHIRDARWPELYESPPDGWKFFRLNTYKNKTKKVQQWAKKYFTSIPEDERETRTTGAFAGFSGQVFKEFYRATHVIDSKTTKDPELRAIAERLENYDFPESWRHIRGIDFGWSNPLACIWIAVDPDGRYYCYDEHYKKQIRIEEHARQMSLRPWLYGHPNWGVSYCDNEEPASINYLNEITASDDGKYQWFRPVQKMPNDIGRQLSKLRSMLMVQGDGKPKIFFLSKCKNLISEVRGYRWQEGAKGPNSANPREIPVARNDHCLVGGTMIETERGPIPIENVTSSDRVWTRQGWKRVLWSGPTRFDTPYCVSLNNSIKICGTEDHPVWVVGQGMTHIEALQPGDRVLSLSETTARPVVAPVLVVAVSRMQHAEQTYDLTVEDAHEFFANGVLVSNSVDAMRYAIIHDAQGPPSPIKSYRADSSRPSVKLQRKPV